MADFQAKFNYPQMPSLGLQSYFIGPWFLHWMVAHFNMGLYGVIQFDLSKAFGYIERVVKSIFFSEKTYFTSCVRNMFLATIL